MRTRTEFVRQAATLSAIGVVVFGLLGCERNQSAPATVSSFAAPASAGTAPSAGARKNWGLPVTEQPGSVFHVEYSDKTVIVDAQTVAQSLRGFSADHDIFLFADSPALRQKLAPGSIVLLQGLDVRKVDALAVDGPNLVVGTENAPLRDVVKNAQMQWSIPVDFQKIYEQRAAARQAAGPDRFAVLRPLLVAWDEVEPTAYASTSEQFAGETVWHDKDFATWKMKYQQAFDSSDRSLNVNLQIHREAAGMDAEIEAQAHVSKFTQTASILMADGQFKSASFKNTGLHGTVNFDWTVATSQSKTPMDEVRVKLPGKISVPLEFTGLPMSLQISEALLFHPAFPTKGAVAKGGFKVNYSGDEGFTLAGSDLEPDGEAQGESAIGQTYAFSPLAGYGLVVAMAVPRVELRMGTEEVFEAMQIPESVVSKVGDLLSKSPLSGTWLPKAKNPLSAEAAAYFQVVISTSAAHSGMQSLVPCQQFTMLAKGQVGISADVLGVDMNTTAKDIFTKSIVQRQPDSKICGGGDTPPSN